MTTPAGAPPRYVDLHAHTTASDGSATPAALVAAAERAGLVAVALTDHDTLAGVEEAAAEGTRRGIRVIGGVELSVHEGAQELHLLGLHLFHTDALEATLRRLRDARRDRARQIVERLNAAGVPLTLDEVLAQAGTGAVGRPHVARALIARGFVADLPEAFARWLRTGRPAYVEKLRLSVGDAVRMLHQAGGVAVLAHPGPMATRSRLEALRDQGLDGVEVRHPSHSADDVRRIGGLAQHVGLLPSGGSDWHGASDGPRTLGTMHVPEEWLVRQAARAADHAMEAQVA